MATEQEELRLIVTLVDNASAGLDKIVEKSKELGGPQVKEAHAKMAEGTKELSKLFKDMSGGFGDAFKALSEFRGGLIAGVGGLAIFGAAVGEQIKKITELAQEMRGLNQAARAIGIDPTSMKNIIDQFEAIGVSADQTKANLSKMAGAVADLSRIGSTLRRDLMHNAGASPEAQAGMRQLLDTIVKATTEEERYNAVAAAREQVRKNALRDGYNAVEATNRANQFASRFWDTSIAQMQKVAGMHDEERKYWKERFDAAEQLSNKFGEMKSTWSDIANVIGAPTVAMQNLKAVVEYIQPVLDKLKDVLIWLDRWSSKPSAFGGGGGEVTPLKPGEGAQGSWLRKFGDQYGDKRSDEEKQKAQEDNTKALKELNDAIKPAVPWGYRPSSGVGFNPADVHRAAFTTGGGGGYGAGGDRGYGAFGGGQAFGGAAPYGSHVGPGTGRGAGGTPARGGGGGGAAAAGPSTGEVAEANQNLTGVGGYNFMGSARAREMGMGDVAPGSAEAHQTFATGIPKGEGPASIQANKYAGPDMAGFLKDLHDAGAPLKDFSGVYANRGKRGGGGPSQHAYGNAMDIETGFGSGPNNSPALYAWAQAHPKEFAEIQAQHHMRNLDTSSGAHMHDWGHFEWTPDGKKNPAAAAANAGPTGAGGSVADRETVKGSWFGNAPGWSDPSEPVGSPKSSVPGIALRNKSTIGKMFEVTTPDGRKFILPQTDYGPSARTGRGIDITAAAGAQMGYTANTFPTDKGFSYRQLDDDRKQIDKSQSNAGKVEGTGKISVDVNAPKGTSVGAEGGGIFKDVEINRQTQMEPAKKGPETLSI
jgi:hypothetical protein